MISAFAYQSCIHVALCSLTLLSVLGDCKEWHDIYSFSNDTEDCCHFSQYPFNCIFPFFFISVFSMFFLCTLMLVFLLWKLKMDYISC
ncbi:hypothetical protein VIGAN_05189600 [Vigna angularis var. angularis]|uniref:Prolamin-like domain-containing protein n=1 Tax=Vigna angularis var. angularis TaxID=157739 RepID=A0A0S3S6G0_PHAAN|nr:hypothetical protein VIGAN_05189600 [Vigna angularis var. angularis]